MVETTRLSESGVEGSGVPRVFVLGKGLRAPRGWELALYGAHKCCSMDLLSACQHKQPHLYCGMPMNLVPDATCMHMHRLYHVWWEEFQ